MTDHSALTRTATMTPEEWIARRRKILATAGPRGWRRRARVMSGALAQ